MSSLLEQAIADAKMLKETARKNIEADILEQYSQEIKNKIESLLEADDAGLGDLGIADATATAETPVVAPVTTGVQKSTPAVKNVMDSMQSAYLSEGDLQEIEIDLNSLVEKVSKLEEEFAPQADYKVMGGAETQTEEEQLEESSEEGDKKREAAASKKEDAAKLDKEAARADTAETAKKKEEENKNKPSIRSGASTMSEEKEFTLDEEIMMDMSNVRDPDNTEIEVNKQKKIAAALQAQQDDLLATLEKKEEEKNELEEALDAAIAKLNETKAKLKNSLDLNIKLKEGVEYLTQKVNDSNLLNARLLYTNKTLGNISLNERQKNQIAESISSASSVEEAKTIYETLLKSTASASEKRNAPQSLTEALNKGPSPFLPRSNKPQVDPTMDRWKILAGIRK